MSFYLFIYEVVSTKREKGNINISRDYISISFDFDSDCSNA